MAHTKLELEGRTIFVSLHTSEAPSNEEWKSWMDMLEGYGKETSWELGASGNLVLTDGGAPTVTQRTAVNMLVSQGKTSPWVAIVTESAFVRTMLRALSIFNPRLHAFAPKDALAAAEHLQLRSPDALHQLVAACSRLEREMFQPGAIGTLRAVSRLNPR